MVSEQIWAGGTFVHDHSNNLNIHTLPGSKERSPLFIIGDVHGCAIELEKLIKKARSIVSDCRIILVGDLFTKGPDPVGVYDIIQEYNAISIKGNHDWALISSLLHASRKGVNSLSPHTQQTLHLIRHHRRAILDYLMRLPHILNTVIVPEKPKPHWETEYPLSIVHAGIEPILGAAQTTERMLLTARWLRWEEYNGNKKLCLVHSSSRSEMLSAQNHHHHVQHPHPSNAQSEPAKQSDKFQPVSGFPHSEPPDSMHPVQRFRWHELWNGPDLIVFGHDAKQGLFRKTMANGRPICIGLDTGCTYGRMLTGYFPEKDDAIQVDSARLYFDMANNQIIQRPPAYRNRD